MNVWEKRLITAIKKACAANSPYYTYTLKDSTLVLETAVGLDEGAENVYPLTLTKVG